MSNNKTISDIDTNNHNNIVIITIIMMLMLPQNLLHHFHVKDTGINIIQIFITLMCVDNGLP